MVQLMISLSIMRKTADQNTLIFVFLEVLYVVNREFAFHYTNVRKTGLRKWYLPDYKWYFLLKSKKKG